MVFGSHYPAEMGSMIAATGALAAREATNATETPTWLGNEAFNITTPMQQFGFAIVLFFPILAFICCGLRVYARVSVKQFALDDTLVCIAMLLSIGETSATYMYMRTNFVGIHYKDIPYGSFSPTPGLVWNFAVQLLYNPILALVKTSGLLFLLRLGGQKPGARLAIHIANGINLSLMVAIFLVAVFQCTPIRYNWDTTIEGGKCIKQGVFYVATAALTLTTDVMVLAIPIYIFADLKMKMKMKIGLMFVFLLGSIVTIVGAVRFWVIYEGFFGVRGSDPTYTIGFCTSAIETNIAIITASAPALRPLFRQWFPHLFSTSRPTGSGYGDTYGLSNHHKSRVTATANASVTPGMMLKDLKNKTDHKVMRSHSPSASEEEIMTFDGIMRTTNVRVSYAEEDSRDSQHDGHDGHDTDEYDSRNHGPHRTQEKDFAMRTSLGSL